METKSNFKMQDILAQAINEPGKIMAAYRAFHGYSFGNQLLAMVQCELRGIPFGPIATYKKWNEKGRQVKKGEKAIELCMPVSVKREKEGKNGETKEEAFTFFSFRRNWFVLSQTEGEELAPATIPDWNESLALKTLEIERVAFEMGNGNVQGYALDRKVAINPVAQLPLKTLFHELGHIVLGHTDRNNHDAVLPRDLKEVEAESVALLCIAALNLPGQEFCRGYIQNWIKTDGIPEKSAQKIMAAADKILKAGMPAKGGE